MTETLNIKKIDKSKLSDFYKNFKYILYGDTDSNYCHIKNNLTSNIEVDKVILYNFSKIINISICNYLTTHIFPILGTPNKKIQTEFKTELISDGMLMLDQKKHYAFRELLNKHGNLIVEFDKSGNKVIGKIRYKGIPVQKSDYSEYTKYYIKKFIDIALDKSMDFDNKKLVAEKMANIGLEMSNTRSSLSETYKFEFLGTPAKWNLRDYKKDTAQLTGFKLYNTITNSETFTPGSDGKVINVKTKNVKKIEPILDKGPLYLSKEYLNKITFLGIPYSYEPNDIKELMENFNLEFDFDTMKNKLNSTILNDIKDLILVQAGLEVGQKKKK